MDPAVNPYSAPQARIDQYVGMTAGEKLDWQTLLFSFKGRIPRKAYWLYGVLTLVCGQAVILGITTLFGLRGFGLLLYIVAILPIMWAHLALAAKRWHDRDKSAWWLLIYFIPVIGGIWAFVEVGCLRGTIGNNNYGGDATGLY